MGGFIRGITGAPNRKDKARAREAERMAREQHEAYMKFFADADAKEAEIAAAQEAERKRRKAYGGRASTILTGAQGDDSTGMASKTLLGGGR
jgi:Xaa-Pro aminopeptidase